MREYPSRKVLALTLFVVVIMVFSSAAFVFGNELGGHQTSGSNSGHSTSAINPTVRSASGSASIHNLPISKSYYNATSVMNQLKALNVNKNYAYLPNMNYRKGLSDGLVQPGYSSYPAPMGIGDFGLNTTNGQLTAYNLTTSSIEGNVLLNSSYALYPGDPSSPHSFSMQLNAVLNNVTVKGVSDYVYWTQNVAFYSTRTHQLTLIDNVWNFTSQYLPNSTIYSGNGIANDAFPTYYFDVGPTFNVTSPFILQLYLNSTVIGGRSAVFYNYSLAYGTTVKSGSYDEVVFNSTYGMPSSYSAPKPHYLISGNTQTPTGLLNDAELILGGPGGGSTVTLYNLNGTMNLKVLGRGGHYANVPSAYDYGTDTGETSEGVAVAWNSQNNAILNTGPSFLYGMWNASQVTSMRSYFGKVTPSNAFMFVSPGSSYSQHEASWVPLWTNGEYHFVLPSNTYTVNVSLSDYSSIVSPLTSGSYALSRGGNNFNTPLYALNNAQVANISYTGSGSIASQYMLFNASSSMISYSYSIANDLGYTVFYGLVIYGVSAYTTAENQVLVTSSIGLGFGVSLPSVILDSSNITVLNSTFVEPLLSFENPILSGSSSSSHSALNILNSTGIFVGNSSFQGTNVGLYVWDGNSNMIWGNHFISNDSYFTGTGIKIDSSGNTIYNNYFWGLHFDVLSDYRNSSGVYVQNTWNISNQSAKDANTFNGYTFSGSVIGTSYQGGNYWWDYAGQTPPFNDYYNILSNNPLLNPQGDNVPLVANYVHFIESGLPYNLTGFQSVIFNNTYAYSQNLSNEITINVVNGTYAYTVPDVNEYNLTTFEPIAEFVPSVATDSVTLSGFSKTVNVEYTGEYLANFTETGLPSGTTWYVNLTDGESYSTNGTYIDTYLANATYSYSIGTPNKEYAAPGGTFTVSGKPQVVSVSFEKEVYDQVFQENGLPAGTSWSVVVSGSTYTTTSSQITLPLVNGSYNAQVISPTGYFASPSKYIFNVNGEPNEFPVAFAYSSNETFIKPVATMYPTINQILPGNDLNFSYLEQGSISFGTAYDSSNGLLFIPVYSLASGQFGLYVYSTASGQMIKTISVPSYDAIYDQATGYVYALTLTGNVTEINPSTFAIVKNITLPQSENNETFLQEQGNYIYAMSTNGNISQINASTMAITKTLEVIPGGISSIFSLFFTVENGNAYIANPIDNDVVIANFTTSAIKDVYLPNHYAAQSVIQYSGTELLIGGENYSDQLYNTSTGSLSTGPYISGVATSSVSDPMSHTVFIFSSNISFDSFGNITDVNPHTGDIISTIPGVILQLTPVFVPTNQNIYTDVAFGLISDYSVQHYYTATFTESGLPSGTAWYVNITNGMDSGPITGSSYSFSLTNGTYSYTIATSDHIYKPSPSSGPFTVNGAPVSESVTFSKVLYNVTFTESGLPSGVEWYVNGTGVSGHEMSPANITFNLANGTYSFTATNLSNYYTTTVHFSVVISGSNATETVDYYHWAYIAGKVTPTNATVTINGKAVSLTSSGSFNVSVANGTYHVVASSSGYTSYFNNFTLNSGSTKNLTINLKPISKPSTISSTELYTIIGVVVAVVVIVGVIFGMRRR